MIRLRRLVIHNLRVEDLTAFAALTDLQDLSIAGSPKVRSLSGIETLRKLRRLILFDTCNYGDLDAVETLSDLEALCIEGGFSKPLRISTLGPLQQLKNLKRLRLASIRVVDGSLRPLHGLGSLRQVFIAKVFSPDEFRALAAALPQVRGEFVDTFRSAG
jgi:hypothetical protein